MRKLNLLKEQDSLGSWIYARIDHVAEDPAKHFPFLMETEQKLWRKAKTYEEHYAFLNLLNTEGYYRLLNGDILGSINSYETAYGYYLKNKIASYEIVEYTLKPLSNNYTRLGDYERALYLQQLSLNFLIKTKDSPENIASVYSNLAISYRSMLNFGEAEKSIRSGSKLVAPNASVNIILNNIMADILYDKKDYAAAAKLIEANINKQKKINEANAYWLFSAYTTAGNIYLELKQTQKANAYYARALDLSHTYFKESRLREKANILTQMGKIKLLQQQPLPAVRLFNRTLQTLKINDDKNNLLVNKIYGDNKLMDVFEQMSKAYQLLQQPKEAFKYLKLALFAADKIRTEYADDVAKERLQRDTKIISEKAIEICYQYYQKTKDKMVLKDILILAEQSKSRTLLDRIRRNQQLIAADQKDSLFIKKKALEQAIIYHEKQELENNVIPQHKPIENLKYTLSLVDKQIKLKYKQFNLSTIPMEYNMLLAMPNEHVIEYFIGENAMYLIDIKNKKIENVVQTEGAQKLNKFLLSFTSTYFQQGPAAMLNSPKTFFMASNQVYETVLGKIKLKPNEQVIIIPDGVLGYISFDGLITSNTYNPNIPISNWPFLIKGNRITYAFSLNTLLANQAKTNPKSFTGLFITHQHNSNKPLPAVQEEANAIQKTVNGKFLINGEVNAQTFNKAYEESRILHIGTHAYLYGKNQEPTLAFEKEKLFLFELSAKKNAPSLVVLSACRTADGLLANGEGIISLSRGFNAIGTPATIAGLWNVNDVAASIITNNFYKHLIQHKSAGEALHQAKLDWLAQPKEVNNFYDLPYYWDSLIYMGADQKIELTPAKNVKIIYGIGILLLLATGAFVWRLKRKGSN